MRSASVIVAAVLPQSSSCRVARSSFTYMPTLFAFIPLACRRSLRVHTSTFGATPFPGIVNLSTSILLLLVATPSGVVNLSASMQLHVGSYLLLHFTCLRAAYVHPFRFICSAFSRLRRGGVASHLLSWIAAAHHLAV